MKIGAKAGEGPVVEVEYDMPTDIDGLVARFGAEVVASAAVDSFVISIQALIRRHAAGTKKAPPKDQNAIQEIVSAYKPGVAGVRRSPIEKLSLQISKMSEEEKAQLLASLKAQA